MSKYRHDSKTDFQLEGRFLGFAAKDGYKLKYLRLATTGGEQVIKIDKELRSTLWRTLTPGEWIHVSGSQKRGGELGAFKLKAYQVTAIAPGGASVGAVPVSATLPVQESVTPTKTTILVCQKSDCCKRGGLAVSKALQQALSDRDLADQVHIKGTGCMKRCKAGPNIVMPDKTRYSGIEPTDIPILVDKHFCPAYVNS
jgi:(2Fe-2S) ferredoxin